MEKFDKIKFLQWLYNRLIYKYNYNVDDNVIIQLKQIIEYIKPKIYCTDITDEDLDKILAGYYIDYNLDACNEMKIGFTDSDRIKLRKQIKEIVNDVVNKRASKEILIKG